MTSRIPELVEQLSRDFEGEDAPTALCRDIAREVESRSSGSSIRDVVGALGPFLTSTEVAVRGKAVQSLSLILRELRDDFLNEAELRPLVDFYRDRLKDERGAGPSTIVGIAAIVGAKALPRDASVLLVREVLERVHCRSEGRETRRRVYAIIKRLVENDADDPTSMGADFVYGVIAAMDGESDPRNLMLLFEFLPRFVKKFPMGHLTEEMFQVVACYFPIDFNASSLTEKKKIRREDLADALAPCLYAIPEFGEFCLPLVAEKLDSDRKRAKLDSLRLLREAVRVFGSRTTKQHLSELWPLLRREAMNTSDRETSESSLEAISRIVETLADDESSRDRFVDKILDETRWSLRDVRLSLYGPAERILEAVARSDEKSCKRVLLEIVPLCLGQYSTKTRNADRLGLLETLNKLVKISCEFGFAIGDIPELAWTDIPGLYARELETGDNALRAKALSGLVIQKSLLTEGQRARVYEKICDIVESESFGRNGTREACHSALVAFSRLYPNETLEVLRRRLPIETESISEPSVPRRRFEAISSLARIRPIGTATLPLIVDIAAVSERPEMAVTALRCLCRVLASPNADFDVHRYLYEDCDAIARLVAREARRGAAGAAEAEATAATAVEAEILGLVSCVARSIVRKLCAEDQRRIVARYAAIERSETATSVKLTGREVLLYEGILVPLRLDVAVPNLERLVALLCDLATEHENPEIVRSACRIIAVLVNKTSDESSLEIITEHLRGRILDALRTNEDDAGAATAATTVADAPLRRKRSAILLHTWLTKALVARGARDSQQFLNHQINILRLDTVGSWASEEFKTLLEEAENSLTNENYGRIKIFYKQRIFERVLESRSEFEGSGPSRKNYLVALARLVEEVPVEVAFVNLRPLVPLLVESLSLDDGRLLLSTLRTLKLLLEAKHETFVEQIRCFLPKCLDLATYDKMDVRIAALECLLSYGEYPVADLLKYRDEVLERLAEPLDDRKRLVRRAAVGARTRWYLVGAPGTTDK